MNAITRKQYGNEEVLSIATITRPEPGPNEVLIEMRASSVNQGDWVVLTGKPFPVRFMAGFVRPNATGFGQDLAGVVVAVGGEVTRFEPGDHVFGEVPNGAWAEWVCAHEDWVALKPARMSFEEAAASPVAANAALQGLRNEANLQPAERVLINGASGSVGSFAIQFAKAMGAHVTAVCSTRNVELVRELGADEVIDYSREDFTESMYDVIFDLVGNAPLGRCLSALTKHGRYIQSAGTLTRWLHAGLRSIVDKRVKFLVSMPSAGRMDSLAAAMTEFAIAPRIERTYELYDAVEAMRRQGRGGNRAKTVIRIDRGDESARSLPSGEMRMLQAFAMLG